MDLQRQGPTVVPVEVVEVVLGKDFLVTQTVVEGGLERMARRVMVHSLALEASFAFLLFVSRPILPSPASRWAALLPRAE
jgi:hypothetical protein